jgi:predicted transcriptional regulator of viral defense system
MNTRDFMATHPVFSLEEATEALAPPGGRAGTVQRLKHHLASGRLALVARGLYAVVPPGAAEAHPDLLFVAASARPDAVFAYHSALELLGVAHSAWNTTTVFTTRRRRQLALGDGTVAFLDDPRALRAGALRHLGARRVEHRGRLLVTTGPERTLVDGLRRPVLTGGLEELLLSAGAFPTLDLALLADILERYDTARLWAAAGWFLERHRTAFSVPESFLHRVETRRPTTALYLQRDQRGGTLEARWNLIVPESVYHLSAGDERWRGLPAPLSHHPAAASSPGTRIVILPRLQSRC